MPDSVDYLTIHECPACAGRDIRPYKRGTIDTGDIGLDMVKITDSSYGKFWDLSRCDRCTHVFANPVPKPEFIHSLYSASEDPLYEEEADGRRKNFLGILRMLDKFHPQQGRIFDVGTATGILLHLAEQRGWIPEGIEPSEWCVRTAREKYALNIIQGDFTRTALGENLYSAVTMIDFIEHIAHPFEAVDTAHRILTDGGILCIVTPDIKSLTARLMGRKWWHFRPAHLGYFTRKSLITMLDRAGFSPVKTKKYTWTFSVHYLLSRLRILRWMIGNPRLDSLWRRIPIKLALRDSLEIYVKKKN